MVKQESFKYALSTLIDNFSDPMKLGFLNDMIKDKGILLFNEILYNVV